MPVSITGPAERHRRALGRIPGLETDESIEMPGQPARDYLASTKYCNDKLLEARQTINGIYFVQTIDWFLEFAPTENHSEAYQRQFWKLVRDQTGLQTGSDPDVVSPNYIKMLYSAFRDGRRLFKKTHRAKYPSKDITDEQAFFIDLLDDIQRRFTNGYSRFQLHYGLRRDDNFGERMASRILQWRLRLENSDDLLISSPQIAHDVLPVDQQDQNFKQMAQKYALLFDKVSCKTTDQVAADDDVRHFLETENFSPKTNMLKKMSIQLAGVSARLEAQEKKSIGLETKLDKMERGMRESFDLLKKGNEKLFEFVKKKLTDAGESVPAVAADMNGPKRRASLRLRGK